MSGFPLANFGVSFAMTSSSTWANPLSPADFAARLPISS